jgi:hypothetical protein
VETVSRLNALPYSKQARSRELKLALISNSLHPDQVQPFNKAVTFPYELQFAQSIKEALDVGDFTYLHAGALSMIDHTFILEEDYSFSHFPPAIPAESRLSTDSLWMLDIKPRVPATEFTTPQSNNPSPVEGDDLSHSMGPLSDLSRDNTQTNDDAVYDHVSGIRIPY